MKDLEKLKMTQLNILQDIDVICKNNKLNYYLVGGTLLGAIRHKGFIPWDDDIDIAMPRKDLNKLEEILNTEYNTEYFVQNPQTDKYYLRYITKVRKKGTRLVEEAVEHVDMNHGVYIDIFPLDKISNKNKKIIDFRAYLGKYARNLKRKKVTGSKHEKGLKLYINTLLALVLPIKVIDRFVDWMYQMSNSDSNHFYTNFGSKYGWRKQTFHESVYGDGLSLKFEDRYFQAPEKWETILESLYGDYMALPSDDNKVSGHKIIELDLGEETYKK